MKNEQQLQGLYIKKDLKCRVIEVLTMLRCLFKAVFFEGHVIEFILLIWLKALSKTATTRIVYKKGFQVSGY
ncbi:MAG: hypothetical protein B6247_09590 [Candidatus Parabeggiatoa sp. nov. 2]|nr:MAG: hypothetical protein B6247_09590 [Beggiatoa sp. 4572_84]